MKEILFFLFLFSMTCGFADGNDKSRFLLVTGCGRSGTEYMSLYLQAMGLQVLHEREGEEGTVSWPMVVNNYSPWGPQAGNVKFLHAFHQVRNPLHVITSWYVNIQDLDRDEWIFVRTHVPEIKREDSLLVHCAKYWYYWNLKAEKMSEWRYRIEDIDKLRKKFEKRLEKPIDPNIFNQIPKNTNTWYSTSDKITWSQLKREIPSDLFENLQQMAKKYGYSTQD